LEQWAKSVVHGS